MRIYVLLSVIDAGSVSLVVVEEGDDDTFIETVRINMLPRSKNKSSADAYASTRTMNPPVGHRPNFSIVNSVLLLLQEIMSYF